MPHTPHIDYEKNLLAYDLIVQNFVSEKLNVKLEAGAKINQLYEIPTRA